MKISKTVWIVAATLGVVGAANWILVGAFGFDLVEFLFRFGWLIKTAKIAAGIGGIYAIFAK